MTYDEMCRFDVLYQAHLKSRRGKRCKKEVIDFEMDLGQKLYAIQWELLNGKYKYLLGTQRDIFRLKTRGAEFKISPITQFNDLYQIISVTSKDSKKQSIATQFINHLISESNNINELGLMYTGKNLYDDEMREMENLSYESKLTSPISESMKKELEQAVLNSDLKKLKNLLN